MFPNPKFWPIVGYDVAVNPRVASTATMKAIVDAYYPELPYGHQSIPTTENPQNTVLLIIRDPVERFRSAMAFWGLTDPDSVINSLILNEVVGTSTYPAIDAHFRPQHYLISTHGNTVKMYRLDDSSHIDAFEATAGVTMSVANESATKPTLTSGQEGKVLDYYARDKVYYDLCTSAGYEPSLNYTIEEQRYALFLDALDKSRTNYSNADYIGDPLQEALDSFYDIGVAATQNDLDNIVI